MTVYYTIGLIMGMIALMALMSFWFVKQFKETKVSKRIKEVGQKEEIKINNDLKVWASHNKNKFIGSSVYSYDENKVFEVDSILITDKALIVVEIKSLSGGVVGSTNDLHWTKVLGEKRFQTTNPIQQNERHISHINRMTGIKVPTISLIVYSSKTQFIKCEDRPSHVVLTKHHELFKALDMIQSSLNHSMTIDEMKHLEKKIKIHRTNRKKDLQLHRRITSGKEGA